MKKAKTPRPNNEANSIAEKAKEEKVSYWEKVGRVIRTLPMSILKQQAREERKALGTSGVTPAMAKRFSNYRAGRHYRGWSQLPKARRRHLDKCRARFKHMKELKASGQLKKAQ